MASVWTYQADLRYKLEMVQVRPRLPKGVRNFDLNQEPDEKTTPMHEQHAENITWVQREMDIPRTNSGQNAIKANCTNRQWNDPVARPSNEVIAKDPRWHEVQEEEEKEQHHFRSSDLRWRSLVLPDFFPTKSQFPRHELGDDNLNL
ncbi:hypothetical protein C8R44DRAFT_754640 [Mycena epipterygia]|nr:hypothetical protein C8R44DRAFT_754640 [Mycena epipterygia]